MQVEAAIDPTLIEGLTDVKEIRQTNRNVADTFHAIRIGFSHIRNLTVLNCSPQ